MPNCKIPLVDGKSQCSHEWHYRLGNVASAKYGRSEAAVVSSSCEPSRDGALIALPLRICICREATRRSGFLRSSNEP